MQQKQSATLSEREKLIEQINRERAEEMVRTNGMMVLDDLCAYQVNIELLRMESQMKLQQAEE